MLVEPRRQRDLRAQVRGLHLEPGQLVVLGPGVVHVVGVDDVGLAGLDPRREDAYPQRPRRDLLHQRAVFRRNQRPFLIRLDRAHEGVGQQHAVVQVQRLAIRIATGGAADFDEFLDLGVLDRDVDRGRPTPQRTLADRERQAVHHANERDHARGLAVATDLLADAAQIAPVAADAAALRRQPHILVPQAHDAIKAVRRLVQEARDRQPARRAAIGQDRRGRHEPKLRHVVIDALRMRGIIAIGRGHARKQVLEGFSRQQIAILERRLAEIGQQRVTRAVDLNLAMAFKLNSIKHG